MRARRLLVGVVAVALSVSASTQAADWGLKEGKPGLKSAHSLAFGPDGVLFVADAKAAAIFAIGTGDSEGDAAKVEVNVKGLNAKVAEAVKASVGDIKINDLAVNPASGNIYLSVSRSAGDSVEPALAKVTANGEVIAISLGKVAFSKVELPDAPEDKLIRGRRGSYNPRLQSITDLAYSEGKVLVSGMSKQPAGAKGRAPANVREIPFPFVGAETGTPIVIYHGAHGKEENYAVARTFVPFVIDGEANLLAGFTCTPLVKFPVNSLKPGKTARGTTVAELGNRNTPLDMIVYERDGENFVLMANDRRGVMKISTKDIERQEGITERVGGGGIAGQKYDTIESLQGVVQLDKLNDDHAVILVQNEGGAQDLTTIALP